MLTDAPFLFVALAAIFGLTFGSFLNVCIYRLPRDLSVVTPRSFCPECGHQVAWHDNLPLLSYVLLRGRCRSCGKPIGIRYLVVELTTGALFALTVFRYGPTVLSLKWCVFDALLVALFWTDLEERILPDELTLGGALLGLLFSIWVTVPGPFGFFLIRTSPRTASFINALIGGCILSIPILLLGWLYGLIRKREGLGRGDVKLLALIGVFLGLEKGLLALLIGAVSGAVLGLAYILWKRKDAASYELPFGSFLCLGALAAPFIAR